jgi:hypothetical protein
MASLSADTKTYNAILAWGQNTLNDWFHPVTRGEFVQGLESVKVGDIIQFILDGTARPVQVVSTGANYEYSHLKHLYGDVDLQQRFERVIRVKLLA